MGFILSKLILKLNFDICTVCNHKCSFCSNPDSRTVKHKTNLIDFVHVMKNISKYVDIKELGLSAKGEPLLNNDLSKIIYECKNRFLIPYVYFSTNGVLLNERIANDVLEAGIDSVKFSINAIDSEGYKKTHKFDDFNLVVENLKNFLRLKRDKFNNVKVLISSVLDVDQKSLENVFSEILGDLFLYVDNIFVYKLSYTPKMQVLSKGFDVVNKCPLPFTDLYVNSDGSLGLCCKDYFNEINFGLLLDHDFMNLYNSNEFEAVRGMHKKNDFPDDHLCKKCLLYGMQG